MTNKLGLRAVVEFMTDYTPVYQPFYPLLLSKSQAYTEEVGKLNFNRVDTVGDIRAKHITPKDNEMKQVTAKESTKSFKKYFLANQYVQSSLQDPAGIETVQAQVLDEHQKQFDELVLLGEGTSNSTMINNGLYHSNDVNYVLKSSAAVAAGSDHLIDMYSKIIASLTEAELISGRLAVIFFGTTTVAKFNGLYAATNVPIKRVLSEVKPGVSFVSLPAAITPAGAEGWIVVNLDQVKLHYCALPKLDDSGVNAEKKYVWSNFIMGSSMVEVLAPGAIIQQPVTYA